MVYVAKRMQDRPNNVQTAVEMTYDLTFNQIARANMQAELARKWFPFIAAVFFFILISNLIGYIPLPTNTEHPIHIGSFEIPSFAIYAATANVSVPLVLTLIVWFSYHVEGIRAKGFIGYFKGWLPAGIGGGLAILVFPIEVISQFVRIISLSVRLFANLLGRPPADPVHGRRARGHPRHRRARPADLDRGDRLLHLRGHPDRRAPGLHLFDLDRHLPR